MSNTENGIVPTDLAKVPVKNAEKEVNAWAAQKRSNRHNDDDYYDDDDEDDEVLSSSDDDNAQCTDYTVKAVQRLEDENAELRQAVTSCTEQLETGHRNNTKKEKTIVKMKQKLAVNRVQLKRERKGIAQVQKKVEAFIGCIISNVPEDTRAILMEAWEKTK